MNKRPKLTKGMPSAVLLSILVHAALFLLAGTLVVFTVVKKKEIEFEPPRTVERPKMKLKKPKVKVKKTARPKSTTHIVTKINRASMPEIQIPEMSGISEGLGEGIGGFDMSLDLEDVTILGAGQSIGNDFVGTFYDLKRDRQGRNIPMDPDTYIHKLKQFALSGWKPSALSRYYRSPKKLYATTFMIPPIRSSIVPALFGEPDTLGYCWMIHYQGQLVHKEGITFRFWGIGDNLLIVRVDGKIVIDASLERHRGIISDLWQTSSPDSFKYWLANQTSTVGDWITLEPGVPLDMDVMIGEAPGGIFSAMLLVEVEGVEYEKNRQGGPILPMFKTATPSFSLLDTIYEVHVADEASLTNGPVFCDYDPASKLATNHILEIDSSVESTASTNDECNEMRVWETTSGLTMEAEFVAIIGDKAVLRNSRGKQQKILFTELSEKDREYIELSTPPEFIIDFVKKSSQRFPKTSPYQAAQPQELFDYVFSARIKQISAGSYNHELQVEFFAIGSSLDGRNMQLLDHQKSSFTPCDENQRSHEFSGKVVTFFNYEMYTVFRGKKYKGYLVIVRDVRGKIIAHETSSDWLFEHLDNLQKLPVGAFLDETCTRVHPIGPKTHYY